MTKRACLRLTCVIAMTSASLLVLVGCGNGDDNTSPTPMLDAGPQLGTVSTGNLGILCFDGGIDAGDAGLTPYNTCSFYSAACIPFDPARVPIHPTL